MALEYKPAEVDREDPKQAAVRVDRVGLHSAEIEVPRPSRVVPTKRGQAANSYLWIIEGEALDVELWDSLQRHVLTPRCAAARMASTPSPGHPSPRPPPVTRAQGDMIVQ